MKALTSALLAASSLVFGACIDRGADASADSAESAIDSADSASAEGNVMMSAIDGSDLAGAVAITPETAAARIAANISARYQPAGCATVTQTGATIKAVYADCTGPRGLVHVSGELDLVVTVSLQGAITAHATSTALQVNKAELTVDATGTFSTTGTSHQLVVSTTGSGVGPRGLPIEHEGNYTVTWDTATQCHTLDGQWSTEIGARTRSNDVTMSRCAAGCPTGSIAHTFLRGQSVTITFDGTPTATWAGSGGRSGTIALACQ